MPRSADLRVGVGVAVLAGAAVCAYIYHRRRPQKLMKEIRRVDYAEPCYVIETVMLIVKLDEPEASARCGAKITTVEAELVCRLTHNTKEPLVLNAEALSVLEVFVGTVSEDENAENDGWHAPAYTYDAEAETLTIEHAALKLDGTGKFALRTLVALDPSANLELQGLFKSSGIFCTQARRPRASEYPSRSGCCTADLRVPCPDVADGGGRLSADDAAPRSSRRALKVRRSDRGGCLDMPRAALERQPDGQRSARWRPPLCDVPGPVPQALLPLRPRRGQSRSAQGLVPHSERSVRRDCNLHRAAICRAARVCDGVHQEGDGVG